MTEEVMEKALAVLRSIRTVDDRYRVDLNDDTQIEPVVLQDIKVIADQFSVADRQLAQKDIRIRRLLNVIAERETENAKLREALKPFSERYSQAAHVIEDEDGTPIEARLDLEVSFGVTYRHLRQAHELLSGPPVRPISAEEKLADKLSDGYCCQRCRRALHLANGLEEPHAGE